MTQPQFELARAIHSAADLLVGKPHDEKDLREALSLIEAANALLDGGEDLTLEHRALVFASEMVEEFGADVPADGVPFDAFALSPFSGAHNALRPQELVYRRKGEEIHAEMIAGRAYEGAPDRVHGGLTAAVFDDVMGALQRVVHHYGYTRTLHVSYLGRVPIDEPVHFVARLTEFDQRTFTMTAEASYAGEKVAAAKAIFTEIDFEMFNSM